MSESEADLAALLAFLDACEAPVASPGGSSGSSDSSKALFSSAEPTNASVSSGSDTQASGAKRRRKDPNHARSELHKELVRLRAEAQKLEGTLAALVQAQQQVAGGHARSTRVEIGDWSQERAKETAVWREIAARQIERRTTVEDEHQALKLTIKMQEKQIEGLQGLVFSKINAKAMEAVTTRAFHPHTLLHATLDFDTRVFPGLMDLVETRYRGIDQIFAHDPLGCGTSVPATPRGRMRTDENGHLYFQIFGSKILPFDVQKTGTAAWKRFSFCVRPNGPSSTFYTTIFSKLYNTPDDTINELFASEMRLNDMNAIVLPVQVKRLYREQDRVAIVWHTRVNPVEFMGCPLTGAEYQETGYFLIERPPLAPDGYSLLRTCYVITPSVPTRSVPRDSTAFALVEFVFKWMSATIPTNHQIVEDMLIRDELGIAPTLQVE